jgi:glycosyltransferase involved in cell wall biosynthesis
MRVGVNPQKDKVKEEISMYHQVVIPVYIPSDEGYFEHSFDILKLCLDSLFKTCHCNTHLTIVNNGSYDQIVQYLDSLLKSNQIHELIHTHNVGKVNAVYKGIMGHNFSLITVTDADVLFLEGWQENSYLVFEEFPKTGFVTPTPNSKLIKYFTFDTIIKYWFSSRLSFKEPKNKLGLQRFADSIENPQLYNQAHLNNVLTLNGKSVNAVIGGGHFVATYRGAIFNNVKERYSNFKLGGKSDCDFFDLPVAEKGYWRLSTEDNFAFHMGNNVEPWMQEVLDSLPLENKNTVPKPPLKTIKRSAVLLKIKAFLFERILTKKIIWHYFLIRKGLRRQDAEIY